MFQAMDKFKIWDVMSYAWTEIGLEEEDFPQYAAEIYEHCKDWDEVSSIITKDVCGSFAFDSFLICPCMLWMIMPDWGYDQNYLKVRMEKWYSKPCWVHFLNPLRIFGYPIALFLSWSVRLKLKKAFYQCIKGT